LLPGHALSSQQSQNVTATPLEAHRKPAPLPYHTRYING
jgi:hypothetical protein